MICVFFLGGYPRLFQGKFRVGEIWIIICPDRFPREFPGSKGSSQHTKVDEVCGSEGRQVRSWCGHCTFYQRVRVVSRGDGVDGNFSMSPFEFFGGIEMFNKKACKGSEWFTCDVGIINLFLVDLEFMFWGGVLTTPPPRSYPTQIRKMNIRAFNSCKWSTVFQNLYSFFFFTFTGISLKIRCFFISTSHFWCKRPWLAPISFRMEVEVDLSCPRLLKSALVVLPLSVTLRLLGSNMSCCWTKNCWWCLF